MPTSSSRHSGQPTDDDNVHPTLFAEDTQTIAQARRDRLVRRIVIAALGLFVLAGLLGVFGYRQGEQHARTQTATGDYDVTLSYPTQTRGGLPARWQLTIERADDASLPELEVRTTASYLDLFDFNSLTPDPDVIEQSDDVVWTFAPSDRPATTLVLDVRTQPGSRWTRDATTTVLADGEVVAAFDYRTTAIP